jgi:hypothetical protein
MRSISDSLRTLKIEFYRELHRLNWTVPQGIELHLDVQINCTYVFWKYKAPNGRPYMFEHAIAPYIWKRDNITVCRQTAFDLAQKCYEKLKDIPHG